MSIYGDISMLNGAMRAFQYGLNTTSNNIANVNTLGYSRQVLGLQSVPSIFDGSLALGQGVDANSLARAATRIVLHNLLVLKAPEGAKSSSVGGTTTATATLVMTEQEAQTFGWAMKNTTWFLVLRPTNHPRDSRVTLETLFSFLGRGLNPATAQGQLAGGFGGTVDGP